MAKTFGIPGTHRSGPTLMRPALSHSAASHLAAGEALTPRRPQHGARRDGLLTHDDTAFIDILNSAVQQDLDPLISRASAVRCDPKDSENAGSKRGAACTRITRASAGSNVRNSLSIPKRANSAMAPASSTPVGPPPTIRKVRRDVRSAGSATRFCPLEGGQDSAPYLQGIFDAFEPRGMRCPSVLSKITVSSARRQHQVVIRNLLLSELYGLPLRVNADDGPQKHSDGKIVTKQRTNVGPRYPRGRVPRSPLDITVAGKDESSFGRLSSGDIGLAQSERATDPAESGSYNHDSGQTLQLTSIAMFHCRKVPRQQPRNQAVQ